MPRRSASNKDKKKDPPRSVRRSSRLNVNNGEENSDPSTTETHAVAASVKRQQELNDDSSIAQRTSSKPVAKDTLPSKSLSRKRNSSSSSEEDSVDESSRKKTRPSSEAARVSLDATANNDDEQSRKASPKSNVKNASTITPGYSVQSRSRKNEEEEKETSSKSDHANASFMGPNHDDSSDSSRSSVTGSRSLSVSSSSQVILPTGVVDLYSSEATTTNQARTCRQGYSISKSLDASFLASYGLEFYNYLKEHELEHGCFDAVDSDTLSSTGSRATPRSSRLFLGASRNRPALGSAPLVGDTVTLPNQPYLTEKMRAILMDWLVELSEEYKFREETLQLAVALVDACLACGPPQTSDSLTWNDQSIAQAEANGYFVVRREMLQCVGCACMWIASKIEEIEPPCAQDFVYISDNSYSKQQIADMELTVCTVLEFRLAMVTPYHFMDEFLRANCACGSASCRINDNAPFKNLVIYLLELSFLPAELAYTPPSLKAAAAVYIARVTLGIRSDNGEYWSRTLAHYSGYDVSDLEDVVLTMHRYHYNAEESQLRSCFTKFSKEKYGGVALQTVALESEIGF